MADVALALEQKRFLKKLGSIIDYFDIKLIMPISALIIIIKKKNTLSVCQSVSQSVSQSACPAMRFVVLRVSDYVFRSTKTW